VQLSVGPATHTPDPLHVGAPLKVPPEQLAAPHVVPTGAGLQVPTEPALVHVTHAPPVQALLQQTPLTQKPLWHAALVVQAAPRPAGVTQAPPMQRAPLTHCASPLHDVRQEVFEQR
jgi:hypothetical protein